MDFCCAHELSQHSKISSQLFDAATNRRLPVSAGFAPCCHSRYATSPAHVVLCQSSFHVWQNDPTEVTFHGESDYRLTVTCKACICAWLCSSASTGTLSLEADELSGRVHIGSVAPRYSRHNFTIPLAYSGLIKGHSIPRSASHSTMEQCNFTPRTSAPAASSLQSQYSSHFLLNTFLQCRFYAATNMNCPEAPKRAMISTLSRPPSVRPR